MCWMSSPAVQPDSLSPGDDSSRIMLARSNWNGILFQIHGCFLFGYYLRFVIVALRRAADRDPIRLVRAEQFRPGERCRLRSLGGAGHPAIRTIPTACRRPASFGRRCHGPRLCARQRWIRQRSNHDREPRIRRLREKPDRLSRGRVPQDRTDRTEGWRRSSHPLRSPSYCTKITAPALPSAFNRSAPDSPA